MKYSRQRNVILDIVRSSDAHPTADTVYDLARQELPGIGIATVYRNLNMLAENGDILRINTGDGRDRFDGRKGEHYHMICSRCGEVIDIYPKDNAAMEELRRAVNLTFGIKDDNVQINTTLLTGVCNRCLGKEKKN